MDTLRQDFRYAIRRLVKNPAFTGVALLTLALGIGANTAIFSVVYGVLLKPLPYANPEQLVGVFHVSEGERAVMSGPNFTDVKNQAKTLQQVSAFTRQGMILTGQGEPVRLDAAAASGSLFDLLAVEPRLGRALRESDNQPGHTRVVVLSYNLWQHRFGGQPTVVGKRIMLDGVAHEVVGVMPEGFSYPSGRSIWTPLEYSEQVTTSQRSAWYLTVIGRARPGVSLEQVTAEVETIGRQLAVQYPDANEGLGFTALSLHEATVGDVRKAVLVLLGAVGCVLLIACVNVANLLLARAAARESEIAVRSALGAGRGRLIRQLLTESVILGVLGGALGLLLAVWGVEALLRMEPQGIPRLRDVQVDRTVIGFTMALSLLTGMLFGLVPAFQSTRSGLSSTLKESGRGALTSRNGTRMRTALVVAEVALAVTLLAGAGLLIRSFSKLASVDPGFNVQPALAFDLSLPEARYEDEGRQIAFFDQLMPKLKALPGVQDAAGVLSLPLSGASIVLTFEVAGRPPAAPSQQSAMQVRIATTEYFKLIGIPIKRGRGFVDTDRWGGPPVVVITEAAARQYFPGEEAIGKRITLGWRRGPGKPRAGGEVVGIIGDIKDAGLAEPDPPQIYLPYAQWPIESMTVILKTAVTPEGISESARRAVYSVDGNIPVSNIRTLDQVVARSISQPRFYMTLLAIFAGVAAMLAAIGIFGVLSYAVAQRTREIGIRMALGAHQRTVVTLIVREAMLMAFGGLTLGILFALPLTKWLVTKLLFDTKPNDPLTFVTVAVSVAIVALASAYVPARRATRVDPIIALRAE